MEWLNFKGICLFISIFVTIVLIVSIATLFFVPRPSDVINAVRTAEMIYALKLSLITASISTVIVMALVIPMGYALSRFEFFGKSLAKSFLDLPMAFPELVLGLALLLLFSRTPIGDAIQYFGIRIAFTKIGVIVAQTFTAMPYATRVVYSAFEDVNRRYELVSMSLGYTKFETFSRVTLPLARNGILASTIITFARCMGAFGSVLILAGGTYMKTEVLPITLYLNISYGNLGMAITSGMVLIVVSFVAIFLFERLERGTRVSPGREAIR